ncbi:MAG: hypothetical protein JWP75_2440 [Frondihabitans sp.]|nr:hypothetical protein [Frondihabitans sp.]
MLHLAPGATLGGMTTTLHRYSITETPRVAEGIAIAATTWPELQNDRGALLRRIIEAGTEAIEARQAERVEARRAALDRWAGSLTGVFPPDVAQRLKEEWRE